MKNCPQVVYYTLYTQESWDFLMFTPKQLWGLLIPLMLEQLLSALMGIADTMMVSNVGSSAIAAVSLVDSVNVLMIQLFSAMATGGSIVCSQYIGRREIREATDTGKQLLLAVFSVSAFIALICITLRQPLLRLIFGQVEQDVMRNALIYMLVTSLSFPFLALYNAGAALFRACGNSRLPMTVSVLCNLVNVAGNALLIFGFRLGVLGAAIPTLVSRVLCAVMILWQLRKPHQTIIIRDYLHIRPNLRRIGSILRLGIPTGVENSMFQFGKLMIQSSVSTLGTTAIAAQAMAATLEGLASNAPIGIGLGMMTVVGQCMGAGRVEEAKRYIRKITGYGWIAILFSCAAIGLLVRPITILGGMEPQAAEMCVGMVYLICLYKPIAWTLAFLPGYGMRAAGDVRFSMLLSSSTMWVCRVMITVILIRVFGFGPVAVWIGMFSDWTLRAIAYTLRYRSGKWAEHRVLQPSR